MTSPREESPTVTSRTSDPVARRILVVFGTRPEAIKLCPVIAALRSTATTGALETLVCVTAQHRELLDQVTSLFGVQPDFDLNLMRPGQLLGSLSGSLLVQLEDVLRRVAPAIVIVQGDTTTAFCAALAAFYAGIPVAHVEAGLRTGNLQAPFPEEMNRVLTGRIARYHFAPTEKAAQNLLGEGVALANIVVTGNTSIDAILAVQQRLEKGEAAPRTFALSPGRKRIAVTTHRRENFGAPLRSICAAMTALADRNDVEIVWPLHPNPNVQATVRQLAGGHPRIRLTEPLDYLSFVDVLRHATILITDSGGIQEEGPSLGKPVLVLRDETERPEAITAGTARLVGTTKDRIMHEAALLLDDAAELNRRSHIHNPFGDGHASSRIATHLIRILEAENTRSPVQ